MIGQIYPPAVLPLGKLPLVPIGWEAGRALEPVWTQWRREKFPSPAGNRKPFFYHIACSLHWLSYFHSCYRKLSKPTVSLPQSHDSSVGIALGYELDDHGSRVRFPPGAGNVSPNHSVHNGSGAHPAPYPMGTRGSFSEGKAAGAWSWPLTSI
jgi:hypothetical protein